MQKKTAHFTIRGMNRDLSESSMISQLAYENKNLRLYAKDENTTGALTNHKGNVESRIMNDSNKTPLFIKGTPIGQAIINNYWIIFTTEEFPENPDYKDRIYKIWKSDGDIVGVDLYGILLFNGNLNFNIEYPIKALEFYENEEIQKVYWVDGLNQIRYINIASSKKVIASWNNNSFDFIPELKLEEEISITKKYEGGIFNAGTVQYAISYYNLYGSESNLFYISPLYYTSGKDRGYDAESSVFNSFIINIENIDTSFDFIRIYSIRYTSLGATPEVRIVGDINKESLEVVWKQKSIQNDYTRFDDLNEVILSIIVDGITEQTTLKEYIETTSTDDYGYYWLEYDVFDKITFSNEEYIELTHGAESKFKIISTPYGNNIYIINAGESGGLYLHYKDRKLTFVDTGVIGSTVDPALLLNPRSTIYPKTIEQKDNVLFLGNIKYVNSVIAQDIKNEVRQSIVECKLSEEDSSTSLKLPPIKSSYPYESQLNKSSQDIKHFKYLETYRLGVQFQNTKGEWSEALWVKDIRVDKKISGKYYERNTVRFPIFEGILGGDSPQQCLASNLVNNGYLKVRPLIAVHKLSDRECICQGILCPTVYNAKDRYNGTAYAQSSWFLRPNLPTKKELGSGYIDSSFFNLSDLDSNSTPVTLQNKYNSVLGFLHRAGDGLFTDFPINTDTVNLERGSWIESRHNIGLESSSNSGGEIQSYEIEKTIFMSAEEIESNIYMVDQSVVTMHSPEAEFDDIIQSLDMTNLKLRIIGMVPITGCLSYKNVINSSALNRYKDSLISPPGFLSFTKQIINPSRAGFRGLHSSVVWFDVDKDGNPYGTFPSNYGPYGLVVYPWNKTGSLNGNVADETGFISSKLEINQTSNLHYSYNSHYFNIDNIWNAYEEHAAHNQNQTGISGAAIFNNAEIGIIKLKVPENSPLTSLTYKGNEDTVISSSNPYCLYKGLNEFNYNNIGFTWVKPINIASKYYDKLQIKNSSQQYEDVKSSNPISIKYKSSPHIVMALNYTTNHKQAILPTLMEGPYKLSVDSTSLLQPINRVSKNYASSDKVFWEDTRYTEGVEQTLINVDLDSTINGSLPERNYHGPGYGWLWLGELYNDSIENRFGGTTEEALENNEWIVAGEVVDIRDFKDTFYNRVTLTWTEGDTYYQRYDHIKTMPFTLEDENQVVEIASFMCETRTNLDGRYDRNRGMTNNSVVNSSNFNLINTVYSQSNNFFIYHYLNRNKKYVNYFPISILTSPTKASGAEIDSWTTINSISLYNCDGTLGDIVDIHKFNNKLILMQSLGVSRILFNEKEMIQTNTSVPINISSQKSISGIPVLSKTAGLQNRRSSCITFKGIYFIDQNSFKLYFTDGETIVDVGNAAGCKTWFTEHIDSILQYDKITKELLAINTHSCLAFAEDYEIFTSLYSYENTPYFMNLGNSLYSLRHSNITYPSRHIEHVVTYKENFESIRETYRETWYKAIKPLYSKNGTDNILELNKLCTFYIKNYKKDIEAGIGIITDYTAQNDIIWLDELKEDVTEFNVLIYTDRDLVSDEDWEKSNPSHYTSSVRCGRYEAEENEFNNLYVGYSIETAVIRVHYDFYTIKQETVIEDIPDERNNSILIWENDKGNGYFYDKWEPYYTTLIVNSSSNSSNNPERGQQPSSANNNKIFDTIDIHSDGIYDNNCLSPYTFDTIHVWNHYQNSQEVPLVATKDRPSNLKKKFQIWRVNMPRDKRDYSNIRRANRMCNPWLYIKLSKQTIHDDFDINNFYVYGIDVNFFE